MVTSKLLIQIVLYSVKVILKDLKYTPRVIKHVCCRVENLNHFPCAGGFHMTSSPPCWWMKTKDLSVASFGRPLEVVHFSIVIGVSGDWLKTSYCQLLFFVLGGAQILSRRN